MTTTQTFLMHIRRYGVSRQTLVRALTGITQVMLLLPALRLTGQGLLTATMFPSFASAALKWWYVHRITQRLPSMQTSGSLLRPVLTAHGGWLSTTSLLRSSILTDRCHTS